MRPCTEWRTDGTTDLDRNAVVWPAQRAGLADVGRAQGGPAFPHARFARQEAHPLRARQRRHRRRSAVEGDRQGLRVRQGQLCDRRGAGHPLRGAGKSRDGGSRDLCRCRRHRPALLRKALHPGARQEGRKRLCAAARDLARYRQGGHCQGGDPHPRIPGRGDAAGGCVDPAAAAVSAGSGGPGRFQAAVRGGERVPHHRQGAGDGQAADRVDVRQVAAGGLPRRVPRQARADPAQAHPGQGRHHAGGRRTGPARRRHHQRGGLHVVAAKSLQANTRTPAKKTTAAADTAPAKKTATKKAAKKATKKTATKATKKAAPRRKAG